MIAQKWVVICDSCGAREDAKRVSGQYNEHSYEPPDDWGRSSVNPQVHFCKKCTAALLKRDQG